MVRPMNLLFTWLSGPLLLELDIDVNASTDERDDSVKTPLNIILLYFMATFQILALSEN